MPHINLPEGLQGIRNAMASRPETAKPPNELAEAADFGQSNHASPEEPRLCAGWGSSVHHSKLYWSGLPESG